MADSWRMRDWWLGRIKLVMDLCEMFLDAENIRSKPIWTLNFTVVCTSVYFLPRFPFRKQELHGCSNRIYCQYWRHGETNHTLPVFVNMGYITNNHCLFVFFLVSIRFVSNSNEISITMHHENNCCSGDRELQFYDFRVHGFNSGSKFFFWWPHLEIILCEHWGNSNLLRSQ